MIRTVNGASLRASRLISFFMVLSGWLAVKAHPKTPRAGQRAKLSGLVTGERSNPSITSSMRFNDAVIDTGAAEG